VDSYLRHSIQKGWEANVVTYPRVTGNRVVGTWWRSSLTST